jgi:excisionase family DNA binding protein
MIRPGHPTGKETSNGRGGEFSYLTIPTSPGGGVALVIPPSLIDALARRTAALILGALEERSCANPSPYLTVSDAARYLGWPRERIYKLTAAKAIPHFKHGGRLLFRPSELDRWMEEHREGRQPAL